MEFSDTLKLLSDNYLLGSGDHSCDCGDGVIHISIQRHVNSGFSRNAGGAHWSFAFASFSHRVDLLLLIENIHGHSAAIYSL